MSGTKTIILASAVIIFLVSMFMTSGVLIQAKRIQSGIYLRGRMRARLTYFYSFLGFVVEKVAEFRGIRTRIASQTTKSTLKSVFAI
jgi:hypothetical protein